MSKMWEIKNKQLHSYLSDDLIIEEILTRLPIKSILRFKSVSKQWYSTLSSSDFANAHLIKSPFSHPSAPVNTLFITSGKNHYLFSYDDDDDQISGNFEDNLVKLDVDFGVEKDHLRLTGCCNGLVCLTPASYEYFIIWNPATRMLHKYPSHGYFKRPDEANHVSITCGFGYASSVDDYKCVVILSVYQGITVTSNIVHVFSMRENRWRKIDFFHDPPVFCSPSVLVRGKLYWSAYSTEQDGYLLVSFDLAVERFDVINIDWDESDFLGVMRGCLSKCKYSETFTGDKLLHIMEPPVIVKSIGLPKGLKLDPFSQMIGFTKTDKFFVTGPFSDETGYFPSRRTLGIVDTCMEPMQYRMLLRFNDELITIVRYVPSLVLPFPIEKPSEA
ncbi:F-box/kelch-repeat protein At3g23880-like [Silene latifolia]|uniref:F-box/kelch-repeat protein At3g23880-like n=1 Tax=Silene latifolia TaxID=37657 RepID=UPI003D77BBB2